ncbi:DgyrCDS186 [Dimorphilus gyrociliatus]|uniref:Inositol-1-monophosphatase n=1 Tax=Dimorphilus gyrociliatus TaxID=2664684 RepID=A0A7I8V411_9ANNE|nr:DgyrCDS186 [Dimorphilus gyrociliatus]
MDHDIENYYRTAEKLCRHAGEVIKEAFYQDKLVEQKSSIGDLVTETDKKVEDMVVRKLLEIFPSHEFIGEENTAAGKENILSDKPTWVIDPIDGTNNFVHRFPFVCISVGLLIEKKPVVGIIYNPITDEYYHAIKGQGAFCNGERIHVKKTEELKDALLCTEFGSSRDKDILDVKLGNMRKIIDYVHG